MIYYMIRDVIEGEPAIKGYLGATTNGEYVGAGNGGVSGNDLTSMITFNKAKRYLPMPNPQDLSPKNTARYRAYVSRAVFYPVCSRTLEGMVGQVFLRDPIAKIPSALKFIEKDADGSGLSLTQLAKRGVRYAMAYGRGGILTDYPVTDAPQTKAALKDNDIRPTIKFYPPWDIINWRIGERGAKAVFTLIVLRESIFQDADDGFELVPVEQFRVLRLNDDDVYTQQLFKLSDNSDGSKVVIPENEVVIKDGKGKPFTEIAFQFIGSENNDAAVDKPPMYDLASVNLGHYRNSADYEESCFLTGQATLVLSGLDQGWVDNVLKGTVSLGSREAIPLPVNARADIIQAKENGVPMEAMKHKEEQMVSIGAKLVQRQKTTRTATETIVETTSESSTLANVATNVSSAIVNALKWAARFASIDETNIEYNLNKDYDLMEMTPEERLETVKEWQAGAITWGEMRSALRRAGIALDDDTDAFAQIQKEQADAITLGGMLVADPLAVNKIQTDPQTHNPLNQPVPPKAKGKTSGANA